MKSVAVCLLAGLIPIVALGQQIDECTSGEYAQYKDRARTDEGLETMARDYCVNRLKLQRKYTQRCQDEQAKLKDAAAGAGVGDRFGAMTVDMQACVDNATRMKARRSGN